MIHRPLGPQAWTGLDLTDIRLSIRKRNFFLSRIAKRITLLKKMWWVVVALRVRENTSIFYKLVKLENESLDHINSSPRITLLDELWKY